MGKGGNYACFGKCTFGNCVDLHIFSNFPQIVKSLKTRKSEDLSIWSWILWVASSLAYILYAVLCTDSFMLIFEAALELMFCVIILICAIVFRDKSGKNKADSSVKNTYPKE